MSPLWRDEVAIYLAARKIALVRRDRSLRPRIVESAEVPVPDGDAGVFARLAAVLAEPAWQDAVARVVVADHPWACYGVVQWPAVRLDAAARLAHARYTLGDTYGEAVADWTVTLADSPPGQACVACAMPATLQGAIEDVLAPARLRLVSLQPRLIVSFNAWRRRLPADDAWFVSMDDGSLSAVHLSRGAWDRVYTARLSPDFRVEFERLQAFARLTRAAGASGRMFVDAPARMRRRATASDDIEWLEEGDGAKELEITLLQRMDA